MKTKILALLLLLPLFCSAVSAGGWTKDYTQGDWENDGKDLYEYYGQNNCSVWWVKDCAPWYGFAGTIAWEHFSINGSQWWWWNGRHEFQIEVTFCPLNVSERVSVRICLARTYDMFGASQFTKWSVAYHTVSGGVTPWETKYYNSTYGEYVKVLAWLNGSDLHIKAWYDNAYAGDGTDLEPFSEFIYENFNSTDIQTWVWVDLDETLSRGNAKIGFVFESFNTSYTPTLPSEKEFEDSRYGFLPNWLVDPFVNIAGLFNLGWTIVFPFIGMAVDMAPSLILFAICFISLSSMAKLGEWNFEGAIMPWISIGELLWGILTALFGMITAFLELIIPW